MSVTDSRKGGCNLKRETVIKVLKRYAKGLIVMEKEAEKENFPKDEERYRFDAMAMEQAIKMIERSNT